ncbi:MAG: hypothetical protein SFY80_16590 [Verrucomicrobiota bacterium]|nr:hypothetical protein [Verrucomicrobiota bacterium]
MPQPLSPIKVPKLPFLIGYLLLFTFGCALAVFNDWPPSLGVITAAIVSGFFGVVALTIPWLIEWFSQNTMQRHQSAQADKTFHFVVGRMEEVLERLKIAEDETSKTTLIARQIPERINEQLTTLLAAIASRENADLAALRTETESLRAEVIALRKLDPATLQRIASACEGTAAMAAPLGSLSTQVATLKEESAKSKTMVAATASAVGKLDKQLELIDQKLTDLPAQFPQPPPPPEPVEAVEIEDAGTAVISALESALTPLVARLESRIDELSQKLESLESRQESSLVDKLAAMEIRLTPQALTPPASPAPLPISPVATLAAETAADDRPRERDTEKPKRHQEEKRQPLLFGDEHHPHRIAVEAEAMIGITNKLYLRGEGPWLSWEKGTPMDVIGIGRWRWSTEGVKKPILCQIFRNDSDPSDDGRITIEPGKTLTVRPRFTQAGASQTTLT